MTGIPLKRITMPMKLTIISYQHFVQFFPMNKMKIKTKNLESPWINKGIKKSSKKKQRLCSKLLKKRRKKNEKRISRLQKSFSIY